MECGQVFELKLDHRLYANKCPACQAPKEPDPVQNRRLRQKNRLIAKKRAIESEVHRCKLKLETASVRMSEVYQEEIDRWKVLIRHLDVLIAECERLLAME